MLYQLSYAGAPEHLERETGIEPATNSLEGCDSTTELLPRSGAQSYSSATIFRNEKPGQGCWPGLRTKFVRTGLGLLAAVA